MGRKLDEDDVIRVMCQRIVGVSEDRARIIASHIPTAEPSASDCWSNDNKTTNDSIVTKSSRYSTDRTTDGLISRHDAIKEAYPVSIDGEVFDVVQVETLMGLPSAQPEIIRCRDCKYASPNAKYGCKAYHFKLYETHEMNADDFCSHAERRTDE